jgi:hypothetical protein
MIRHVVLFRWNETVTDDQLVAISAGLDALPSAIPEIVAYRHGRDLGLGPTNFQYAIAADFADAADFAAYRDHPAHQRFITEHITGRVAERSAVQFEITD